MGQNFFCKERLTSNKGLYVVFKFFFFASVNNLYVVVCQDLEYPCSMLETMRRCWAGAPALRPSAAALVSLGGAPEYAALADAAAARPAHCGASARLAAPHHGQSRTIHRSVVCM